jgi:hypothetical protein
MGLRLNKQRKTGKRSGTAAAKALAPEDIRRGDFVVPLLLVSEWPSFHWCGDDAMRSRNELVRIATVPTAPIETLRVRRVCLPFVLAKSATGELRTIDVRLCRLARVDGAFAKCSRRAARRAAKQAAARVPSQL